ncbi:MAG: OprD family outer membrane porin, partial [Gammaproteobacteria bacterium]|nr:OprD family outer membrane porin [Gammaproteobacteria bacterium]
MLILVVHVLWEDLMTNKLKLLPLAMAGCMMISPVMAADSKPAANTGKVSAQLKSMVILDAEDNGYDPSEGWSYLAKLKYETPSWNNIKLGMGYYSAGDFLNQTDIDKSFDADKRLARGMFVDPEAEEKSLLGEFYLKYDGGSFGLHGGRQLYNTPLTSITYSTMPNFHTAFGVSTTAVPGLKLQLDQVTQMSLGARAATDYGLIGEGTQTAGSVCPPQVLNADGSITTSRLEQAKFHDISTIALCKDVEETNGMTVIGGTYTGVKGLKISAWDYYAEDISNTFYLDGSYGMPVGGLKLKLFAQYLTQSENGSLVEDNPVVPTGNYTDGIDYNLFGLKAVLKGKKWMTFAAYNKSNGDTGMYNSWGGDPAYTSSIFSRNAYRENV